MQLILIACSNLKRAGGKPAVDYRTGLAEFLNPTEITSLFQVRRELARIIGLPSGPDLGDPATPSQLLLPAYHRYAGKVFETGKVRELFPKAAKGCRLLIVSALYGILDANDLIRKYDLTMTSTLPGRQRVLSFWKAHGLGEFLREYMMEMRPAQVHDLLPKPYRQALHPWPPPIPDQALIKQYEFPDMGMGALFARGRILNGLLEVCAAD